jgi:hypothetical protein
MGSSRTAAAALCLSLLLAGASAQTCPATTTATSCYTGLVGPQLVVAGALATLSSVGLTLTSGTPAPLNVTANQPCVSATVSCVTLLALAPTLSPAACPVTQSMTAYLPFPNSTQTVGMNCSTSLQAMQLLYGFTAIAMCTTTNCNSPSAVSYITGALSFDGYTTSTFGTVQAAQFTSVVANAVSLPTSAVTVTSVAATSNVTASGRHLLLTGITVSYSIATTLSMSTNIVTALATAPPSVAQMQAAGLTQVTTLASSPAGLGGSASAPPAVTGLPNTSAAARGYEAITALLVAAMLALLLL